jgi:hypothetical protein
MILKEMKMDRLGNTVRPVMRSKSHKGISFSLVKSPNRQWKGLEGEWKRGGRRGVGGEMNEKETLLFYP